jgi:hypothetical protein
MTVRRPKGLGYQGRKLWQAITEEFVLDLEPQKQRILFDCCKMADQIDLLEKAAAKAPLTVPGSRAGMIVIQPLVSELRFARALLAQLLARLNFEAPDDEDY